MIRRSAVIATVAVVLSLLVHFLGLGVASRNLPELSSNETPTDVVAVGNAFEDVAETQSEPVPPEPAEAAEPPVQEAPVPAELPTSEALVASDNPQETATPDKGEAQTVQPDVAETTEPSAGGVPKPATVEPLSGGTDAVTPPPVETITTEPTPSPPVAEPLEPGTPQQLAALPAPPITSALPVTPTPKPALIPVIPLDRETVDPEASETTVDPAPEVSEPVEAEDELGGSDLAVASSPRPRTPDHRPSASTSQTPDAETGPSDLTIAPTELIESPLALYQRDGTDLFAGQDGSAQSGGHSFLNSRGPGNSSVTNYVGRVLVHLNRAPIADVADHGYARVVFDINSNGTLARVNVMDSSGSQEINRAAMAQVRRAAPYPRPPNGRSRRLVFVYRSD